MSGWDTTVQNSIQTCSRTVRRILRDSQQLLVFFTDQRQPDLSPSFYRHIRRQTMSFQVVGGRGAPTAVRQGAPARLFGRRVAADEGPERSGGPLDLNRVTKVKTILKNAQSYILFRFCF